MRYAPSIISVYGCTRRASHALMVIIILIVVVEKEISKNGALEHVLNILVSEPAARRAWFEFRV